MENRECNDPGESQRRPFPRKRIVPRMPRSQEMKNLCTRRTLIALGVFGAVCVLGVGCASMQTHSDQEIVPAAVPKELNKVSLPPYIIEPPDILLIDAVRTL